MLSPRVRPGPALSLRRRPTRSRNWSRAWNRRSPRVTVPALLALTVKDTDASTVDEFADAAGANPTRVVIKERDRLTLEGNRRQLLIEVFVERGIEAKLATWRVDVRPPPAKTDPSDWRIERMEPVSNVAGSSAWR